MLDVEVSCTIQGESFSPQKAEKAIGFLFSSKNEPGEIGTVGRYKGRSIPYGSGTLCISKDDYREAVEKIVSIICSLRSSFVTSDTDVGPIHLSVMYSEQCNLELSAHELERIASLGIGLTVSCCVD